MRIIHSEYACDLLIEVIDQGDHRSLYFNGESLQSRMALSEPHRLVLSYTRAMMLPLLCRDAPRRVIVIGIGAGSFIRFLRHHFPTCQIVAADACDHVIGLAKGYFGIREDHTTTIHCCDGLEFLATEQPAPSDLILIDAFDAMGMASTVYNREFFARCTAHLAPGGVVCSNLWSGDRPFFRALRRELRQCFAHHLVLPVPEKGNTILFTSHEPLSLPPLPDRRGRLEEISARFRIDFRQLVTIIRKNNQSILHRFARGRR